MLVVPMKNTLILSLVVLFTIFSGSVNAAVVATSGVSDQALVADSFAPPVLTEREAAMVAYNHFIETEGEVLIPELKMRVTDVEFHLGFFSVTIAMVNRITGSFVRNVAQYEIDGTNGEVISSYRIRAQQMQIGEALARTADDSLTTDEMNNLIHSVLGQEDELIDHILRDLDDHCGDSLDQFVLLMKVVKVNLPGQFAPVRATGDKVSGAVFGKVTSGQLALDRETMRLLDEIKSI
jgi:hypothetical protein